MMPDMRAECHKPLLALLLFLQLSASVRRLSPQILRQLWLPLSCSPHQKSPSSSRQLCQMPLPASMAWPITPS
uniref:Uncharacterized protein n=1 Tax=Rhizophora mucronata TaxID=61149 RepID=A0A2P2PB49_RHIMU